MEANEVSGRDLGLIEVLAFSAFGMIGILDLITMESDFCFFFI